jgi:hypothetical protein
MKAQPRVAILSGVLLPGSGHAAAAEFPVPPDVQWEAIKYPAGFGCGLFAENQACFIGKKSLYSAALAEGT